MVDINIEEAIAASLRGAVENYLQTADLNKVIADALQKQINNVVVNLTGDRKSTRLNSSHIPLSRMPSSA